MKQCPLCKSTYQDETLRYCLSDGTVLVTYYEAEATAQLSERDNPVRVHIPANQTVRQDQPATMPTVIGAKKKGRSVWPWVIGAVSGLGVLLIGIAAVVYVVISSGGLNVVKVETPSPTPFVSATPVEEETDKTDELLKELEKIRKQMEEQQKDVSTGNKSVRVPGSKSSSIPNIRTATVNSPGDGFLALRTLPNSKTGEQIMKMPHGATVVVSECLEPKSVGSKTGRWCIVAYEGEVGWAFDAYLIY